jgi:uncharacterized protein involved in exopolysaccharide biosynthesis
MSTKSPVSPLHEYEEPAPPRGNNWDLLEAMVSRWRVLLVLPLLGALLAILLSLRTTPSYTATTSFIADSPDRSSMLGSFASVASQLGVGIPSSPTNTPAFYADVLKSRVVMERVLQSRAPRPGGTGTDSILVLELYATKPGPPAQRLDRGLRELNKSSAANVNPRTGIIELTVSAPDARAAASVARSFVAVLNEFNLGTRKSQAGQRRRFTGERVRETQDSLARLEEALQIFLQTNRSFRDAPALQARYERIQRQIVVYQELYSNLRREYENARISEVNDTPVITVIEEATPPLRRSAPRRTLLALGGAVLGGFLGLLWLLAVSFLAQMRVRAPSDYERLRQIGHTFLRTLGVRRARRA